MANTDPITGRPSSGRKTGVMSDLPLYLWRSKWVMLIVGLLVVALGVGLFSLTPKRFEASAILQVQGGDPATARAQEAERLKSDEIYAETAARFPLVRLYPEISVRRDRLLSVGESKAETVESAALIAAEKALKRDVKVLAGGEADRLSIRFHHTDAALAEEVLNALIGTYLRLQARTAKTQAGDVSAPEVRAGEAVLEMEAAMRLFLESHNIRDFDGETASASALIRMLSGEILLVESKLSATSTQIDALEAQWKQTPRSIEIFRENTTQQTLLELKLQREDMLTRYKPDSQAMRLIDRRIAQVEAYLSDNKALSSRVQTGPNPVHQAIEAALIQLRAEALSYENQIEALGTKRAPIQERLEELHALLPDWNMLKSEYAEAEQAASAAAASLATMTGYPKISVRLLKAVSVSDKPVGPSLPFIGSVLLLGALAGLFAGLIRALLQRGLAGPVRLARETGLPVLAATRRR